MNRERYDFGIETDIAFEFYSEGPKGRIKKVVQFSLENSNGKTYFNLLFGDWDEKRNELHLTWKLPKYDTEKKEKRRQKKCWFQNW